MSLKVQNTTHLLNLAISETLYKTLICQLNKDFTLSNIEESISEAVTPSELKKQLYGIIQRVIQNEFDHFLNLLYRIDVSEHQIKKKTTQTQAAYIEEVTFLILKREWQKVWFKKNYSS